MSTPFIEKIYNRADRAAMKVGTDGVLLGAWTSLANQPESILDIGAGTGLVALMLAQRSTAEIIDAVEVEDNSFEQCVGNFEASPWSDRLFCYHASFQEFHLEMEETYDLIVSNPPFFTDLTNAAKTPRNVARQEQALPFNELLFGVEKLLAPQGSFCTILPMLVDSFIELIAITTLPLPNNKVKGMPSFKEFC